MSKLEIKDGECVKSITVLYSEVFIVLTDGTEIKVMAVNGPDGPEVTADYDDGKVKISHM